MRTFKLTDLWFKTVQGTPLKNYNWNEIATVLIDQGILSPIASPGSDCFDRYILNHSKLNCGASETRSVILEVLTKYLPAQRGDK